MSFEDLQGNISLYPIFESISSFSSEYSMPQNNENYPLLDTENSFMVYIDESNVNISEEIINLQSCNIDNKTNNNKNDRYLLRKKEMSNETKGEKRHSKYDIDNVLRTIQVHFQRFIFDYINEILNYFGFEEKFYHINYKCKRIISKKVFNKLKTKSIGSILCQEISPKYRKHYMEDKDKNIKLYNKVIKNNIINNILSESYIYLFREIYYKNKRHFIYDGINITLSPKIKLFNDILNNKKYNELYKGKIIKVVKNNYLPKQVFITKDQN